MERRCEFQALLIAIAAQEQGSHIRHLNGLPNSDVGIALRLSSIYSLCFFSL
jgi:hypothetical protein